MEKNGNYYVDSHGLFRIWQKILSTIGGGATNITDITSQAVVDSSWNVAQKNVLQYGKLVQVNMIASPATATPSSVILTGLPTSASTTLGVPMVYGALINNTTSHVVAANSVGTGTVGVDSTTGLTQGTYYNMSILYLCD